MEGVEVTSWELRASGRQTEGPCTGALIQMRGKIVRHTREAQKAHHFVLRAAQATFGFINMKGSNSIGDDSDVRVEPRLTLGYQIVEATPPSSSSSSSCLARPPVRPSIPIPIPRSVPVGCPVLD